MRSLIYMKFKKTSQGQCHTPVVPGTWEAEGKGLFEPRKEVIGVYATTVQPGPESEILFFFF